MHFIKFRHACRITRELDLSPQTFDKYRILNLITFRTVDSELLQSENRHDGANTVILRTALKLCLRFVVSVHILLLNN